MEEWKGARFPSTPLSILGGEKMEVNSSGFTLVNQTYRLDKDRLDLSIQQEPPCRNVHKGYRSMHTTFLLASSASP